LTIEEFEAELRKILVPVTTQEASLIERVLGGWKHEKE
jgi:ybbP